MVPRAVLMNSGLVSINTARQNISKTVVLVNTARQVNTVHSKTTVNAARPMSYLSKIAHSTGNPHVDLQDKGVIDMWNAHDMNREHVHIFRDYEEIGTQSNDFSSTKASNNADPKSSHDDGSKPSIDDGKKVDEDPRKESESIELPFDLNMPALEDYSIFDFSRDDEDDGAMADMNNLDTIIQVSPILTTRIHKDHPLDQEEPKRYFNALKVSKLDKRLAWKSFYNSSYKKFGL
ncbi:hypothetical protein Tco_0996095 [Tanacetum coccineum]